MRRAIKDILTALAPAVSHFTLTRTRASGSIAATYAQVIGMQGRTHSMYVAGAITMCSGLPRQLTWPAWGTNPPRATRLTA